jgi:F0F1-type ATP synthase assembly protein I
VNPLRPRPAAQPISANSSAAFEFVMAPVIMALIGLWLDKSVFHTLPVLTVAFAILGLVGATIKLYYGYKFQMAQHAEKASWTKVTPIARPTDDTEGSAASA